MPSTQNQILETTISLNERKKGRKEGRNTNRHSDISNLERRDSWIHLELVNNPVAV